MGPGNVGLGLFAQLQKIQVKCHKQAKMVSNFFEPSHMLKNNICGNFLFSICFILVFYSAVYFAHLKKFSVLVHCWGIIYECQNTLRQSTLSPYTHRIVVVVSPQTSISSNNWVIMPSTKNYLVKEFSPATN